MKRIFNIFTIMAVLAGSFAFTSCEKSKDSVPVVRFVRSCDPAGAETLLTEVSMGSTVAIIGENLSDVTEIKFNDQSAKVNPTLVTGTSIIVTVPGTMPETVTNKVYLTTSSGKSCEYDFGVIIPSPVATSISCEWAPLGTDVTIYGNYFFGREDGTIDVVFPGNAEAVVKSFTGTEIVCTVPDNATVEGNVSITSAYGTSRSNFTWRCSEGIFIDFEDMSWNWWGYGDLGTEDGVDGQYGWLHGALEHWGWPENTLWVLYFSNSGDTLLPADADISNYSLCFEAKINEWNTVPMIILFNKTGEARVDYDEAQYHWKPFNTGFDQGVWTTITIPLSDFNTDMFESETSRVISVDQMVNFLMMPFGDATASSQMDLCIDNIRLVKNN